MDFEQLKSECRQACRERQACAPGYAALLRAESVEGIINVSVLNWNDVWKSKFGDIVAKNIDRWFEGLENEFHRAGMFVNEETDKGIVVISNTEKILTFTGRARIYILGKAHVIARDDCRVFCRCKNAEAELFDNASGKFFQGKVTVRDYAFVESHQECSCYDRTDVMVSEGICHDYGHYHLNASENTQIIKEQTI